MTIQQPVQREISIIPESAPFTQEQRAWLNGFFAGLLSVDVQSSVTPMTGELPGAAVKALDGDDGEAPWHDAAMPIADRMPLAQGRPLRRKLYAAMAQQDCGQCGYLCESYADMLANGEETRQNLCVPGGKETSRMLKRLLEELSAAAQPAPAVASAALPAVREPAEAGYCRESPVEATFRAARLLNGPGSEKDTRHVVFDIADCGLSYQPGDSFGLYPANDVALADAVLASMNAPADFPVGGKTFRQALIEDYSLGAAPDSLFQLIGLLVGGERRKKANALAKGEDPNGDAALFDVLKALDYFGPIHPDPEALLECLEPLQPRLYSISSSPLTSPGELHLTVDTVRYQIDGRCRLGVASTYLAERLRPGDRVKGYVQKAHGFALPDDPATPIIMVGPGTGVAPFRSFLWNRHAMKAPGRSWLFFGHQREACDFYYRNEFDTLIRDGVLTRLSTAWSRDQGPKVYVQDRMREAGPELWSWLKDGAHIYVCGDAKRMAKDVEIALVEIVAKAGSMSEAGAKNFITELKASGRYQADVY